MSPEALLPIAVATLGGAAIGLERQWSGHATGPRARFAGVRTFTMLGGLAGLCGWLWRAGLQAPAVTLLAALVALIVAAYVRAGVHDPEATTEVAALVTVTAGVIAGVGGVQLASGIVALTWLLLFEKTRVHGWVTRLDEPGLRAGARFAVMALVVLPLLPEGPFGPLGGVRPRVLWALVLFFSGLSFAGYVARRLVGPEQGYPVAGMLGGLISSTSVTLTFARLSRSGGVPPLALAAGTVAASSVLFPRVLIACSVLNPALALHLVPLFVPATLAGAAIALAIVRRAAATAAPDTASPRNPLAFWSAVQMAALVQAVLFVIEAVQAWYGRAGLVITGAALGLTDVDALTLSMARHAAEGGSVTVAAQALTAGIVSNTFLKLAVAAAIGRGRFRVMTVIGLGLIVMALAGGAVAVW